MAEIEFIDVARARAEGLQLNPHVWARMAGVSKPSVLAFIREPERLKLSTLRKILKPLNLGLAVRVVALTRLETPEKPRAARRTETATTTTRTDQ